MILGDYKTIILTKVYLTGSIKHLKLSIPIS